MVELTAYLRKSGNGSDLVIPLAIDDAHAYVLLNNLGAQQNIKKKGGYKVQIFEVSGAYEFEKTAKVHVTAEKHPTNPDKLMLALNALDYDSWNSQAKGSFNKGLKTAGGIDLKVQEIYE